MQCHTRMWCKASKTTASDLLGWEMSLEEDDYIVYEPLRRNCTERWSLCSPELPEFSIQSLQ